MKSKSTTKIYRILLLATAIATLVALIVFAVLMEGADHGTEQHKVYQTWFFYSSYFGISIATVLGILWYFNAPKKKKRNLPLKESETKPVKEDS
ncbi:MAG TPA: hypothetical protein VJ911_09150 [Cryomorphaceae bacterium]|nr:hypothetical protein [Cryomorphaceae bacterium]